MDQMIKDFKILWRFRKNFLKTPVDAITAFSRYKRYSRTCAKFGSLSDHNIFYALGVTIHRPEWVSIGERCSFGGQVNLSGHDQIFIGDDCLFGFSVLVVTGGHDPDALIMNATYNSAPVNIGNNVWLGARCTVLPGITIGDGAIIGAGSIVTKDVLPNTIVAGNPARFIRNRLNP